MPTTLSGSERMRKGTVVSLLWCSLVLATSAAPLSDSLVLPPHPRLRLGVDDVARIRGLTGAGGDPQAIDLLHNITLHAEFVLAQPIPNGTALLCETILDHMYTLGMVYHLSANATLRSLAVQRAATELQGAAALASWNPRRFLTVAETMHGVSIGYDWFYHVLTQPQKTLIEDGLYRAGLGVGLACWHDNCSWTPGIPDTGNCSGCWWIRADMNWNLVSNGGIAIAALALGDVPRYAAAARQALYAFYPTLAPCPSAIGSSANLCQPLPARSPLGVALIAAAVHAQVPVCARFPPRHAGLRASE